MQVRQKLLQEVISGSTRTLGQTAIRYALDEEGVAVAIPGASNVEQLRQNVSAAEVPPLTVDERAAIQAITKANRYTLHR